MVLSSVRHPPTKRNAAAELMLESDLTIGAIAARIGVPYTTVCRWNQAYNWRPFFRRARATVDTRRWSPPRLAALERIYRQPGVDPGDLAQAVGAPRARAKSFFRDCGFPEHAEPVPEEALDGEGLRRSLRGHVARLIADLDAELSLRKASPAEAARMLRDLAMLKKLVEELEPPAEAGEKPMDLAALRADIVRRYEAFEAQQLGREADA